MTIRETTLQDLQQVMEIYDHARKFMKAHGNEHQWINGYPSRSLIESDIRLHHSFVCMDENRTLLGVFSFIKGKDPTYQQIEGNWLNDQPYGTIHRIASARKGTGIFNACVDWCLRQCPNLRIDTHEDNIPMQNAIRKNGFTRCGIIHTADGSPRIAFQKIINL